MQQDSMHTSNGQTSWRPALTAEFLGLCTGQNTLLTHSSSLMLQLLPVGLMAHWMPSAPLVSPALHTLQKKQAVLTEVANAAGGGGV